MHLKNIQHQAALDIVNRFSKNDILNIKKIESKGQVNHIYIVTTAVLTYVVRIDSNETTLDRFNKEKWCMLQMQALGIPSSEVLEMGIKNEQPYMLMSYIEGSDGTDIDAESQVKIWATLGQYARKIHSVNVIGFGESMSEEGNFTGSWNNFIDYNIHSLDAKDKLLTSSMITPEQSEFLKANFIKLKNTDFTFGLMHHDLSLKNTRVNPDGLIYLLDWGSAEVNVTPHMDLIEILNSSLKEDSEEFDIFLKNYGLERASFEMMKPDMKKLYLLLCTDKLRWAIDRNPGLIEEKSRALRNAMASAM